LGILLASWWPIPLPFKFLSFGALPLLALGARHRNIALFILFMSLGMLRTGDRFWRPVPVPIRVWAAERKTVPVLFRAGEDCRGKNGKAQFNGTLLGWWEEERWVRASIPLLWQVASPDCDVRAGGFYRSLARFRIPRSFLNPSGQKAPRRLRAQGIGGMAWISGSPWIVPVQLPRHWLAKRVARLRQVFYRPLSGSPIRGLYLSLTLGDRGKLTPSQEEAFRRAGLSHLLVISGLHLGLVAAIFFGIFYFLGQIFRTWCGRGWVWLAALFLALLGAGGFSLGVGWSPPVLRSFGFIALVFIWVSFKLPRDLLHALGLLALGMLLWDPAYLWNLSFLMSFISVVGIILFIRRFKVFWDWFTRCFPKWDQPVLKWIAGLLGTTLTVNLILFPLTSYYFHQFSLVAPLANLVAGPLFSFIVMPCLTLINLFYLIFESHWLFPVLEWLLTLFLGVVSFFGKWSLASLWVTSPSPATWVFYVWGLIFFLTFPYLESGRKSFRLFLSAGIALWLLFLPLNPTVGPLKVTLFDVGQGESILITLPNGENLLLDGGGFNHGDFDVGERVIFPELIRRRIGKLRAMILSHPDRDHYGGLKYLAKQLPVQEFWYGQDPWVTPELKELKKLLSSQGTHLKKLHRSQNFSLAGVQFEILWPPRDPGVGRDNHNSLVMRLCHQKKCILLTGDIEGEGERQMVQKGSPLKSKWLKVAHHGSRTSTTSFFLEKVQPQTALISVGRANRFGMPHQEVLQRLRSRGIEVLRTDLTGQIEIIWPTALPIPNR
jgi:competence protein ComEC